MRLADGEKLEIEGVSLDVIYTPGLDGSYSFVSTRSIKNASWSRLFLALALVFNPAIEIARRRIRSGLRRRTSPPPPPIIRSNENRHPAGRRR
jgi:hypothetical protein